MIEEVKMAPTNVIRRTYEAYNHRDLELGLEGLHPRVVWDTGEGAPARGRDEVAAHWRKEWETADAKVRIDRLDGAASPYVLTVTLTARGPDGRQTSRTVTNTVTCEDDLVIEMRIS
jgi:ketosteroid isomerase-like protein